MAANRLQKPEPRVLTGWREISEFLGEPVSVVQRWKRQGMPVHRQGHNVTANAAELNAWMGRESGQPVHIATKETDLASELQRGLSFVRKTKLTH